VKAQLWTGIALVVIGIGAAFGRQIIVLVATGLPANGIPWLQTGGFVVAAIGAVLIGVAIGAMRKRRAAQRDD
jgi:fluoride ion exporter CrcB/FEX